MQQSRLTWLKKGDANSKYFQIMISVRKKKNFIHSLQTNDGEVVTHEDKHKVILDHFEHHIGSYVPKSCGLNFSALGW
jgi:hypothetical protein